MSLTGTFDSTVTGTGRLGDWSNNYFTGVDLTPRSGITTSGNCFLGSTSQRAECATLDLPVCPTGLESWIPVVDPAEGKSSPSRA